MISSEKSGKRIFLTEKKKLKQDKTIHNNYSNDNNNNNKKMKNKELKKI